MWQNTVNSCVCELGQFSFLHLRSTCSVEMHGTGRLQARQLLSPDQQCHSETIIQLPHPFYIHNALHIRCCSVYVGCQYQMWLNASTERWKCQKASDTQINKASVFHQKETTLAKIHEYQQQQQAICTCIVIWSDWKSGRGHIYAVQEKPHKAHRYIIVSHVMKMFHAASQQQIC